MATVITGLFANGAKASEAIGTLERKGIPTTDISLVASENFEKDSFGIEGKSKLPEGTAIGAGTGGAVGALVAGLTSVGAVATGGAGLIAAGPVVAALAGGGTGAAVGGVAGASIGAFIPENEVKFYEDALEKGSVLVGVECDDKDRKETVENTFEHLDASRVSSA
jgi:hypothetical protein